MGCHVLFPDQIGSLLSCDHNNVRNGATVTILKFSTFHMIIAFLSALFLLLCYETFTDYTPHSYEIEEGGQSTWKTM
jgi:hypothetical protein